jgi:hypothetical protein
MLLYSQKTFENGVFLQGQELQQELAQSYKAHAEAREQLVTQLTASQTFHAQLADEEAVIAQLQGELAALK